MLEFWKRWIAALAAVVLVGCSSPQLLDERDLLDQKLARKAPGKTSGTKRQRLQRYLQDGRNSGEYQGFTRYGDDQFTGTPLPAYDSASDEGPRTIKLNLVDVPVPEAAKSVLGDVLKLNYSIDSRVTGTITLQTSKPVSKRKLLALFEAALSGNGGAIVGDGDTYRIVPRSEAARAGQQLDTGEGDGGIGLRPRIVKLRYVSAEEIRDVLQPIVPEGMILKADGRRNAIMLAGTEEEMAAIRQTIAVFDVDWMQGMSFALVPVRSSKPDAIVADLEQIFETKKGPLRNIVRFVPNKRLKSVLVISSRAKYLKEAKAWIAKLDVLAETTEESLHVYHVQNRTASELAKVLQAILRTERTTAKKKEGGAVAPRYAAGETGGSGVTPIPDEPTSGPETPKEGPGSNESYEAEPADTIPLDADSGDDAAAGSGVRVVADDANNSLLIFATSQDYKRILDVLEEVDTVPNQVLLEAVIAEVTLDDDLKFGVRWMFGDSNNNGTFTDAANGAISSVFPGFSYFLKANDISFSLNALASVTDVRVLSSPSLVVLDNKTAMLQVGDQVPVVVQTAQGVGANGAPIVNNVELKDTGVILSVTPRVNDSGRVILEIEQEVSSVVRTTTSGIDSPTIRQRKIKTSVVISDGEALALGGLIQEKEQTGKTKVPVLGDIPLLGNAFRQKTHAVSRTELIIFIRPRVIRSMEEARRITREFREELSVRSPRVRRHEAEPGEELVRILN